MPSPFNHEQRKIIAQFYPELAAVAHKYDPKFTGQSSEIKEWKDQKVDDLLKEDLFKTLDVSKKPLKVWAEVSILQSYR